MTFFNGEEFFGMQNEWYTSPQEVKKSFFTKLVKFLFGR